MIDQVVLDGNTASLLAAAGIVVQVSTASERLREAKLLLTSCCMCTVGAYCRRRQPGRRAAQRVQKPRAGHPFVSMSFVCILGLKSQFCCRFVNSTLLLALLECRYQAGGLPTH